MKLTTAAFGLGAMILATPLAAQMPSRSGQDEQPRQQPATQPSQPAAAQSGGLITHQPKLSGTAGKAIVDLQTAVNNNDAAAIPAKLAAAKAAAKTADDRYGIAILELKAASAAKNTAGMAAALENLLASGSVQQNELLGIYEALAQTYTNLKQWQRATDAYNHVVQLNPNNLDAIAGLAEVQISGGQPAAALTFLQQGIKLQEAGGGKAPEAWYKRAVSVAYEAKLPAATELGRRWVAAYPGADSWRNAIAIYRNTMKPDLEGTLDLLRLMQTTGALNSAPDYSLFASAAAEQGNYVEAQSVLDAGMAAKVVDPTRPDFRDIITGLKAKPKLTDADLAEAVKVAQTGTAMVRVGDRYFGLGQYDKAADLYRKSIAKGGVDASVANLHLGMALARSGDKAGATAAFNAVSGPRADIAKYWLLYLQTKG